MCHNYENKNKKYIDELNPDLLSTLTRQEEQIEDEFITSQPQA